MDESERRRHLESLAATPAALGAAVRGLPKKGLLFTPARHLEKIRSLRGES